MRSSIKTLLSLKEWAEWLGFQNWFFAQISKQADGTLFPQRNSQEADCHRAIYQRPSLDFGQLTRDEIALAIQQAEAQFYKLTKYHPAPRFVGGEGYPYPQNARMDTWGGWGNARGGLREVRVSSYYLDSVGTESLTYLGDYAITRSDADGDGISERVSIGPIVITSGTLASEICAFFTTADRLQLPLDEFEIKPLRVTITGLNATIMSDSYLFVDPALQLRETADALAHDSAATYVTEVSIYRRVTNYAEAGSLIWHHGNCPNPPCTATISTPCFAISSAIDGFVTPRPAAFDEATQAFVAANPGVGWHGPDRIAINYRAGYPRQTNGLMDSTHRDIVCLLSVAFLPLKSMACRRADQRLEWYRTPPKDGDRSPIGQRKFEHSPLGNSQAELEAWSKISMLPTMAGGMSTG